MKLKITLLSVLVLLIPLSAQAIPITLNSGGSPQPGNSGKGTIETWIAGLVATYNAANNPDLPAPGSELFRVNQGDAPPVSFPSFGSDVLSITMPTGVYDYIAFHWGGPGGGVYQAFYIGDYGTDLSYTFNAPSQHGLSWYDGFLLSPPRSNVPDSGATVVLLSGTLFVLVSLRRIFGRAR